MGVVPNCVTPNFGPCLRSFRGYCAQVANSMGCGGVHGDVLFYFCWLKWRKLRQTNIKSSLILIVELENIEENDASGFWAIVEAFEETYRDGD